MYCAPVFVYLVSFVLKLEKPTLGKGVAIAVVMLGIVLLTQIYDVGASGVTILGWVPACLPGCHTPCLFSASSTPRRMAARRRFSPSRSRCWSSCLCCRPTLIRWLRC